MFSVVVQDVKSFINLHDKNNKCLNLQSGNFYKIRKILKINQKLIIAIIIVIQS